MCYTQSVSSIEFLRKYCIYDEICVEILFHEKELLNFKDYKLGQILHVDKTGFLRPGYIEITALDPLIQNMDIS